MKLELSGNNFVYVGDKLKIRTKLLFEEDQEILWTGIRLITAPPCTKELQIAKKEVFSKGKFEEGIYIRDNDLLIKNNVVPTIEKRNLRYWVQLLLRKENPINPEEDLIIKKRHDVIIRPRNFNLNNKPNPISFSISGLKIDLNKDIFKPGETIKINYISEGLKELEVRLLQKANLVCKCEQYGQNCSKVQELPPAIAGDAKTKSNTEKGYLLLKVPEVAEPSHNYLWEPTEKEFWGLKYGDYTEWSLQVIGKKKPEFGRENVEFKLPITIVTEPIKEGQPEIDFFSGEDNRAPSVFKDITSKFQETFKISEITKSPGESEDTNTFKIKIKNISKEILKGTTIKLTGLQEGLFETFPSLKGFSDWKPQEEKVITFETDKSVTAIISVIEDNSQKTIRIQSPIK
ncbi:MAG: hypothetical protein P8Y70_07035 [Candidatus Lokiarchaeota archaeon]